MIVGALLWVQLWDLRCASSRPFTHFASSSALTPKLVAKCFSLHMYPAQKQSSHIGCCCILTRCCSGAACSPQLATCTSASQCCGGKCVTPGGESSAANKVCCSVDTVGGACTAGDCCGSLRCLLSDPFDTSSARTCQNLPPTSTPTGETCTSAGLDSYCTQNCGSSGNSCQASCFAKCGNFAFLTPVTASNCNNNAGGTQEECPFSPTNGWKCCTCTKNCFT